MQIQFSTAREVKSFVGRDELRDALEGIIDNDQDFTIGGSIEHRFIHQDAIDKIMADELEGDEYILGCFNANFLAEVTGIDQDAIEAMQKANAYEAVGKLIISLGKLETLQRMAVQWDGYGHHFAHYDGNEEMVGDYYVFRTN